MTLPNLIFLQSAAAAECTSQTSLPEMIHLLRQHLGMETAFISEFAHDRREFRYVDTDEKACPVRAGEGDALNDSYCKHIVDGRIPALIPDTSTVPAAMALPITAKLNIGSYMSAPIRLKDGTLYGTFCCYSHGANPSLNQRDLALMRVCAEMTAKEIERERLETLKQREIEHRINATLAADDVSIVYQPIYDLQDNKVVGFEALSRFISAPDTPPDVFFNEAHAVGLGIALEAKAIRLGLQGLQSFDPDIYVSVNISPETILSPVFQEIFHDAPLQRVTLEITEHAAVDRYKEISTMLRPARKRGLQLAVDDAGAGFASFRHILQLAPDRIKLDFSLTKNVDTDPARRALIAAFVRFSEDTGAKLIAEGIETELELHVLQQLGVTKAQGHLLGRPMPIDQAMELLCT